MNTLIFFYYIFLGVVLYLVFKEYRKSKRELLEAREQFKNTIEEFKELDSLNFNSSKE